jgi:hypothetical protein
MDVYVYQAALLCEECGEKTRVERAALAPENPDDESTYDSDNWPKGPYADGGGEADCPQHCDVCHVFLENPLTSEGLDYVRETIASALKNPRAKLDTPSFEDWAPFYDVETDHIGRLKVVVESQGYDPFSVMFTVQGPHADHWADHVGAIAGGTWEACDGANFVYDIGGLYPGCYEKWQAEGYNLDLSQAPDEDPVREVFFCEYQDGGEKAVRAKCAEYTAIGLHEDMDTQDHILARCVALASEQGNEKGVRA